jgi:hypothetical protein
MRNSLLTLAAFLVLVGTGVRAQAQDFLGYLCQPRACLVFAEGTSFTSGIIITGNWDFKGKNYYKTAVTALTAINCHAGVTMESTAYAISNPVIGMGVLADSVGMEAGLVLIEQQEFVYFFGGPHGFVHPSKQVPCL